MMSGALYLLFPLCVIFSTASGLEYVQTVCEGSKKTISCPTQLGINIIEANYGRTDGFTCPSDKIYTTQCGATDSLQLTRGGCENKNSCQLQASNDVYTDPCAGTYKYLHVKYQCKPLEYSYNICEGNSRTISCPNPFLISVEQANYGRSDGTTCPSSQIQTTQCSSSNSLQSTRQRCDNKSSCKLEANNGVFGDPCVGTYKYLHVKHVCIYPVYTYNICEGETRVITCPSGYHIDIEWANYGRTDGYTCPSDQIYSTQCYSPFSHEYVNNFCNNQRSCRLEAFNAVFGDPCYGTNKYLHVKYACNQREYLEKIVCERSSGSISCPAEKQIQIHSAYYGRTDASTCSDGPIYTTSCMNPRAKDWVDAQCVGKASCDVSANNGLFGDPCLETQKYLHVKYNCI